MTRHRRVLFFLILSSAMILFLAGVLEIGARIAGFHGAQKPSQALRRVPHAERGWEVKPKASFDFAGTRSLSHGTTDGDGFRPVVSCYDQSQSPIVVCLGDSATFGAESPDDRTWPEAASRALSQAGLPCRMLNRGIRGYNTIQCLLTLRETLKDPARAPHVRAVVYFFTSNDPVENLQADHPHYDESEFAGNPAGRKEPPAVVPGTPFPADPPAPAVRLFQHSAFVAAVRYARRDHSAAAFKAGGSHFMEIFAGWQRQFLSKPPMQEAMRCALRELARECESHRIRLFVSSWITPAWDDPDAARRELIDLIGWPPQKFNEDAETYRAMYDLVERMTREVGGTFLDLRGCLQGMTYREYAASPSDWHYSPAANDRIGRALAERLKSAPELKGPTPGR